MAHCFNLHVGTLQVILTKLNTVEVLIVKYTEPYWLRADHFYDVLKVTY